MKNKISGWEYIRNCEKEEVINLIKDGYEPIMALRQVQLSWAKAEAKETYNVSSELAQFDQTCAQNGLARVLEVTDEGNYVVDHEAVYGCVFDPTQKKQSPPRL